MKRWTTVRRSEELEFGIRSEAHILRHVKNLIALMERKTVIVKSVNVKLLKLLMLKIKLP